MASKKKTEKAKMENTEKIEEKSEAVKNTEVLLESIKEEAHKTVHKMNVFEQKECDICKVWMTYCVAEPPEATPIEKVEEWCKEKQKYWDNNEKHLVANGYSYDSGVMKALDFVNAEKVNGLEGSLLIVRVGSDDRPAPTTEIEYAYQMMEKALEGVKGVRVIVTDHKFAVEKVSLPQLRMLQSSVLSSVDPEDNSSSIIRDLEV